jgi:hypothetical protein
MELLHWLMVIGALLLVIGFFGLALHRNVQVTSHPESDEGSQAAEAHAPQGDVTNPPSAAVAS